MPTPFFGQAQRVQSVLIEVNWRLYLKAESHRVTRGEGFEVAARRVQALTMVAIEALRSMGCS